MQLKAREPIKGVGININTPANDRTLRAKAYDNIVLSLKRGKCND